MLRYLKDKTAVFFSFLSIIILLTLYILFIGEIYINDLPKEFSKELKSFLVISLTMGGVLVINTMSLSLGIMGTFVEDISKRSIDAFLVTPVKRWKIIISYYLSAIIVTSVLSLVMWGLTIIYAGVSTDYWYSGSVILKTSGLLILYTFISTSLMIYLVTLLKSVNAFGALSGVLGTLIGFTSGIYMSLALLEKEIRYLASINPFTHMAVLLKQVIMEQSLDLAYGYFDGNDEAYQFLLDIYGLVNHGIFGLDISLFWIFVGIGILSIALLMLAFKNMSKKMMY